ncbi:hypothetical protein A9Q83_09590 [Alphaproteobacteria bacterium 46_93_T64]|nr:hypothetical protein A9Q83_09590 [Alphaproteobacteria bacterium 46_93_T64]
MINKQKSASTKKVKNQNRPQTMTIEVWEEIRLMYETGNYTQRQLAKYVTAKGFSCYQGNIARRADKYNWIKGSLRDEIRAEVLKEYKQTMGEQLVDMLLQHTSVARMMQAEVLRHFHKLADERKIDKNRVLPPNQLATLVTTAKTLQDMEARSFGWNYKEGKPYSGADDDVAEELPVLTVRVMTEEEEQEIREQGAKRLEEING